MRIAFFRELPLGFPGGVSNLMHQMIPRLEDAGHKVQLFVPESSVAPPSNWKSQIHATSVVKLPLFRKTGFVLSFPDPGPIEASLKEFGPDIVHALHPISLGWIGSNCARSLRIPVLSSYHTLYDAYLGYYGLPFLMPVMRAWMRYIFNQSDLTLSPSDGVGEGLRRAGFSRVKTWVRGVDSAAFGPQHRDASWRADILQDAHPGTPILVYAGRLGKEKNLPMLIRLAQKLPDHPLVVIGKGPLRGNLEKAFAGRRVTFLGHVDKATLAKAFASAELLLFPSVTEGCPNVVLEALASGLPVLGAKGPGTGELIEASGGGFLFDPARPETLPGALEQALADPDECRAAGTRGRVFARGWNWDKAFYELLDHYESILSSKRPILL